MGVCPQPACMFPLAGLVGSDADLALTNKCHATNPLFQITSPTLIFLLTSKGFSCFVKQSANCGGNDTKGQIGCEACSRKVNAGK